ncbi:Putative aminoglycoside phosphotransferase, protein kinase-like domain superfamily [Colletotrichum destructivum]|uniref:Aminoglycoside phosphotransferase, protein kinase-like domain superfamily n=1 Tax=Colletotrichum destructivum TaxID=34406 RepID=A0AAX4IGW1_9PEZI|nr:Putative aminoglycoside phosphotransferase, protein kinase-like domain superfamily [Colletotrichum destructivum]
MGTHYPLPFFATSDLLPAPLPTPGAIAASQDILQENSGRRVVRVGIYFVVKYGAAVNLTEGENMLFIKQFSKTSTPTVYAIYSLQPKGDKSPTNYILMENIQANHESNLATCAKFLHLTTLGVLGKRPFEDSVFWAGDDASCQVASGPFDSEKQMLDAMDKKYSRQNPVYRKSEYYSRILPLMLRGHASIFTHGDFQRKNIVVAEDGEVVIIDWEAAGWYPSFWEYSTAMFSCRWDNDWHSWIPQILDEHPNEYAWMDMVFRD